MKPGHRYLEVCVHDSSLKITIYEQWEDAPRLVDSEKHRDRSPLYLDISAERTHS